MHLSPHTWEPMKTAGSAPPRIAARTALIFACIALLIICSVAGAADPERMTTQPASRAASRSDEPLLKPFSPRKASEYLDQYRHVAENRCFACHGSYAYLMAAPIVSARSAAYRETRSAIERSIELLPAAEPNGRKASGMQPTEAVMTAAALAQDDAANGRELRPLTRKTLDRMWNFQQADGGWKWAKLNAPPSEVDDHFGTTMAAIAVGAAPENYAHTPKAQEGLNGIRRYLRERPPATMHNRAMLMLAAARVDDLMTDEQRRQTMADLLALQRPDGGWAVADLVEWKRSDGVRSDPVASDGYGTGFVTYVLRAGAGVPAQDARLRRAVDWMKTHQRVSGCWFTCSPRKDDELSTYSGSAYVILALSACGEIQSAIATQPIGNRERKLTSVRSYRTLFEHDEDPISEGGQWINGAKDGLDWYNVITRNGVAYGAVGKGKYTDPTALLSGAWGKNQIVKAKVFSRNQTEKYYQEVEIRLRSALTRHRCTGYEVFWRCLKTQNAYVEIVRWNGKVGDWTSLKKHTGAQYGVKDGDVVEATIVGNVIKGYINGVEVISATDDTYKAGNPGMGFNFGVGNSNVDFGFTYYEVDSND